MLRLDKFERYPLSGHRCGPYCEALACGGYFRFWHGKDLSALSDDVCSCGKTGSDRRIVKPTRLTQSRLGYTRVAEPS